MGKSADQTATGVAVLKNVLSFPVALALLFGFGEHHQVGGWGGG
jgi:hypothetical protein